MTSAQSMRPPVNPWMRTSGVASPVPRSSTARVTDPTSMVRSGSYMGGNVAPDRDLRFAVVRVGVFPGSFDPLTTAHLAIADAAIEACRLDHLDLTISTVALAKEHGGHASIEERIAAIERTAETRPFLRARTTDAQLIADLAAGYDVCVVGADKWHQLHDLTFYDSSETEHDAWLARLPTIADHATPRRAGSGGT